MRSGLFAFSWTKWDRSIRCVDGPVQRCKPVDPRDSIRPLTPMEHRDSCHQLVSPHGIMSEWIKIIDQRIPIVLPPFGDEEVARLRRHPRYHWVSAIPGIYDAFRDQIDSPFDSHQWLIIEFDDSWLSVVRNSWFRTVADVKSRRASGGALAGQTPVLALPQEVTTFSFFHHPTQQLGEADGHGFTWNLVKFFR